ncbi:orotidine 5'-phosphate decarboxylase [Corynebacterium bovis DSM 20582 = CIP 54.80]|uniref:Orotidine 5'-phosphate decarboxylase n=1 Tax=Corynebacterium bovis DSM 20582 = CIP 54.80 TaxID=927655 RepID=A0A8H9YCG3_9CORY|nr:orotidine-5'-phosphate decarboxylase [Corynebacterium bovis DSM 20582 = CIP 54.80]WJY77592.1 orotidine 5'-phosphate decarboxylase [Corynebacterium bovis DSM 20582 = CIP 54.80]
MTGPGGSVSGAGDDAARPVPGPEPSSPVPTFGDRFLARAREHGRLCVGIDPHPGLLRDWGLPVDVSGLLEFSRRCVEAFADEACLVKPQVAFYEAFGSAGFAVLEETLAALRGTGALVVADAKRGDIGSTMAGYARAWTDPASPLRADAVTVSPYLGVGSLAPVVEAGERTGTGVIILAATSNPEGPQVQGADAGGRSVAQDVVDRVSALNAAAVARGGAGTVGVVVGATVTDPPRLDEVGGVVLMPGVGAQGGTAADVRRIAGAAERLVSPNISRGVLAAGPDVDALRAAARDASALFR